MFSGHKEASRVIWGYVTFGGILLLLLIGYLIFKPSFEKKLQATWKLYEIRINDAIDTTDYLYQYTFYKDKTATLTTKESEESEQKLFSYTYELNGNRITLNCKKEADDNNNDECKNVSYTASFSGSKLILESDGIKEYYYKNNGY